MKRKFMMLTLLISGPKQPGNDIDVYLEPLWVGIRGVYDAHNGEYFTLRAALMWTINDFPAYGNLSGCVVKGYKACPICGDDTPSHRLKNGHKICYIGYRKWLPINHPYRRQRAAFNGKPEYGTPPEPLTGEEVLHMVQDGDRVCWKKKSIFFNLEYWKYLPVRHALDVMHIEKNVCDSIIGTLLEIPGKNKDGIAARLDLLNMGVKTDLQPEYGERRTRLPPGPWNLSRAEKREVCNSFYGMKVLEGYSSNIKNLVSLQDSRLLGLKSHDCHTLMQQLLPVAIRSVLEKPARNKGNGHHWEWLDAPTCARGKELIPGLLRRMRAMEDDLKLIEEQRKEVEDKLKLVEREKKELEYEVGELCKQKRLLEDKRTGQRPRDNQIRGVSFLSLVLGFLVVLVIMMILCLLSNWLTFPGGNNEKLMIN
ncbi:unnamed protein product [Prunus brigantina]